MSTPARLRRIVKRAVMALAVAPLVPIAYLASVGTLVFASAAGVLPPSVNASPIAHRYTQPALLFCFSDLPGSKLCDDALTWCEGTGLGYANRAR